MDDLLHQLCFAPTQACVLAALGLPLLLFRRYRVSLLAILIGCAWLYLCATPAFVSLLRYGLESQYPSHPANSYPKVDAIVVLGGDAIPKADSNWQIDSTRVSRNRLGFAYQLFSEKRARVLVLSADKGGATKMASLLETAGLSASALRVEGRACNTYENALYSAQILKHENLGRVLLVTSSFHMPRAVAAFLKQGINVVPAPTAPALTHPLAGNQWLPSHITLLRSRHYLHEYIGFLVYRLKGWA